MYEFEELIISIITLIFAFVGGFFALCQWRKTLSYKRAEICKSLIDDVRGNNNIATIMDIIDWNKDFSYDGTFHVNKSSKNTALSTISDDELFKMIDHTLSVFSYICYLKKIHTITRKDMRFFEYELRRLIDNPHICNYLYSLYHWSDSLGVKMSFSFVIKYALKKGYLAKSFSTLNTPNSIYTCYLCISRRPAGKY